MKSRKQRQKAEEPNPVYAKRLNGHQRRALRRYYALTGFEPMGQDDFDDGKMTFADMWNLNVNWLSDVLADVVNIDLRGTGV
jgi:hypothetical protein